VEETKKPVFLCWCKQYTDVDVAARAKAFMAVDGATCEGFYESLEFHVGKTCGWCTEFPGPYLAIAEKALATNREVS
jgi:hypothetical protein